MTKTVAETTIKGLLAAIFVSTVIGVALAASTTAATICVTISLVFWVAAFTVWFLWG